MTVKRYEVWLASVRFKEKTGRKNRPAIIWKVDGGTYAAIPVTTHASRNEPGEYQLVRYREAGIPHPSVARCGHIMDLYDDDLIELKGTLQPIDIIGIHSALSVAGNRRRN